MADCNDGCHAFCMGLVPVASLIPLTCYLFLGVLLAAKMAAQNGGMKLAVVDVIQVHCTSAFIFVLVYGVICMALSGFSSFKQDVLFFGVELVLVAAVGFFASRLQKSSDEEVQENILLTGDLE